MTAPNGQGKPSRRKDGSRDGLRVFVCRDCGKEVYGSIKSIRCADCQLAADKKHNAEYKKRRRNGTARKIGEMYPCEACGKLYELQSGLQRYCKACAKTSTRENIRQSVRGYMDDYRASEHGKEIIRANRPVPKVITVSCAVCGKPFTAQKGTDKTCSDTCRAQYKSRYLKDYDAARKEAKAAYNKDKRAKMTDEQREAINKRARENYAKRKNKKQ